MRACCVCVLFLSTTTHPSTAHLKDVEFPGELFATVAHVIVYQEGMGSMFEPAIMSRLGFADPHRHTRSGTCMHSSAVG